MYNCIVYCLFYHLISNPKAASLLKMDEKFMKRKLKKEVNKLQCSWMLTGIIAAHAAAKGLKLSLDILQSVQPTSTLQRKKFPKQKLLERRVKMSRQVLSGVKGRKKIKS